MPRTPATSTITPITLADFSICSASSSEHCPTVKPGRGTPPPSPGGGGSPPLAEVVNRPGHQLLPRPRLATDQDHALAPGHHPGQRDRLDERGRLADQLGASLRVLEPPDQVLRGVGYERS